MNYNHGIWRYHSALLFTAFPTICLQKGTLWNTGLPVIKAITALGIVALTWPSIYANEGQNKVLFNRDIRPIFSNYCYTCHGPDAEHRQSDFRLDHSHDSYAERGGYWPIVPHEPGQSNLFSRISSSDPDEIMPPENSEKLLSKEQIDLVRRWIEQGAAWDDHWSFVAPQRPLLPVGPQPAFVRNPIDHFVLARLKIKGLAPSTAAAKTTWLRRVTFDLTGLPPSIGQIDSFLSDTSPNASEKQVDRLLGSPHYGEHMARQWLDLARYSDTHGMHADGERSIWPFRDWLTKAFNQNMPFDQFTVEQLAGDLLTNPLRDQLVATGFNRCHPSTEEGGSIAEEVRVRYAIDRVATVGTVWMGLSLNCTVCHDHKFDPLLQREFYQLFAYYANTADTPVHRNVLAPPPSLELPTAQQAKAQDSLQEEIAAVEKKISEAIALAQSAHLAKSNTTDTSESQDVIYVDDSSPAGADINGTDGAHSWQWVTAEHGPVYRSKQSHTQTATGLGQHSFSGANPDLQIKEGDKIFTYIFLDPDNPPEEVMLQFKDHDWEHRAYWGSNQIQWGHDNSASRLSMGPLPPLGKWVRLEVDPQAIGFTPGTRINGWAFTQFDGTVYWDASGVHTANPPSYGESLLTWEESQMTNQDANLPKTIQHVLKIARDQRTDAQAKEIQDYFIEFVYAKTRAIFVDLHQHQDAVQKSYTELKAAIPITMIMQEKKDDRRDTFLLIRGEYDQPDKREKLQPNVPAMLPPLPSTAPANRLGLARWLVSKQHPLTARVTMNRFWQNYFGVGIVKSSEEFGIQGDWPSHPQLLDWLATELMHCDWNVKHMHQHIVLSGTYRQTSQVSSELYHLDPENRLFARGPRFRLDAEMIRDQVLAVSGLLVRTIGGRGVKPYQPTGLWRAVSSTGSNTLQYVPDEGDKLFRRSMYTFWKRTCSPPTLAGLDAPSRNTCQVKRTRTNTPLQALILLNDIQHIEAARHLAQRMMTEGGDTSRERIAFAFRLSTARQPVETETQLLLDNFNTHLVEFQRDPHSADKLVQIGKSLRNASLDSSELAAWTMVANLILNLDETLTKS